MDDDHDWKVDCVDEDCYVEPNVNDKGCDITNDTVLYTSGEIGYYCANNGAQGMCCPEGTILDTDATTGEHYCKATRELCFNNVDDEASASTAVDCADPTCNSFFSTDGLAKPCTGSDTEPRNYTYGRSQIATFYCRYGWTEEEEIGYCCPKQSWWDEEFEYCRNDQECTSSWNVTEPQSSPAESLRYGTSPETEGDQACCPVIRFGEAEYTGWADIKIY